MIIDLSHFSTAAAIAERWSAYATRTEHLEHPTPLSINQSRIFKGGLSNKLLPQGPRRWNS